MKRAALVLLFAATAVAQTNINFSDSTPAAPLGNLPIKWAVDLSGGTSNISAHVAVTVTGSTSNPTVPCGSSTNANVFYLGPVTTNTPLYICRNAGAGWAWEAVGGGTSVGGSGTVSTCATTGAIANYAAAGTTVSCNANVRIGSDGTVAAPGFQAGVAGTPTVVNVTAQTIGTLPPAGNTAGDYRQVSNGSDANDCTNGGGNTEHWCRWSGTGWESASSSAAVPVVHLNTTDLAATYAVVLGSSGGGDVALDVGANHNILFNPHTGDTKLGTIEVEGGVGYPGVRDTSRAGIGCAQWDNGGFLVNIGSPCMKGSDTLANAPLVSFDANSKPFKVVVGPGLQLSSASATGSVASVALPYGFYTMGGDGAPPVDYPITFSGGGGSGAAGKVTIDCTSAHRTPCSASTTLTSGGSGYTSAPSATWDSVTLVVTMTSVSVPTLSVDTPSLNIPAAQVQSDWSAGSGMGQILNKPTIPTTSNWPGAGTCTNSVMISNTYGALPGCTQVTSAMVDTTVTKTIASGTAALGTGALTVGTCATAVTATATGALTTDTVAADFNADASTITGYGPTGGGLTVYKWVTANVVNFHVCNPANNINGTITPGAATLNWKVTR